MKTLLRYTVYFLLAAGLCPQNVRAHDKVATELAGAANRWLATLSPQQKAAGQFKFESDQRQSETSGTALKS